MDATLQVGPVLAVDLPAIAHNVRLFAGIGDVMAVVKADGFGHGAAEVARTALAAGARALGVTGVAEALALRAAGVRAPVLSWLNPPDADFGAGLRARVAFAVPDVAALDAVARAAARDGLVARVHLHVDTGMARDGAPAERWPSLARRAREHEGAGLLRVTGVMGHLACAAEPGDPTNLAAVATLGRAVEVARAHGLRPAVRHLAATAGALDVPEARLDLLRVGAGLYGIDPSGRHGLWHALTLTTPVVTVRDVAAGTGVGYGHSYRTPAATRLALLPVGYADGIPYAAAGRASVLLRGRRCPVVGAVSMDQTVVDVGDLPVGPGEVAVVFGSDEAGRAGRDGGASPGGEAGRDGREDPGRAPTTADWARWCGVPEHVVMTGIGPRVRRVLREEPAGDRSSGSARRRRPGPRRPRDEDTRRPRAVPHPEEVEPRA